MKGELVPLGGGDPIPLLKDALLVGRRETCDVTLRFSNVSGHHCKLSIEQGYWFVTDLNSRNGTRVEGKRIQGRKRLDPGCTLQIAKHKFEVIYEPSKLGAVGTPPPDEEQVEQIFGKSLLDRAGLHRRKG